MGNIVDLDEVFKEPTEEELKIQLLKAREIADELWNKLPPDLDFDEYDERVNDIYKEVNSLSLKYRLVKTPVLKEAEDWELEECKMSFMQFKESCEEGFFINYDGSGEYGNATHKSGIAIYPSDIIAGTYRTDFTHVYWYNK